MKIALINVLGKTKSTGKLISNFASVYRESGHSTLICYGRKPIIAEEGFFRFNNDLNVVLHYIFARITKKEGYYSKRPTERLIKKLKHYGPDIIVLMNLHDHYLNHPLLMNYIAENRIQTIYALCDEFAYTGGCTYTNDCEKYKHGCEGCLLFKEKAEKMLNDKIAYYKAIGKRISFATAGLMVAKSKASRALRDMRIEIVEPGVDVDFFKSVDTTSLKQELNISNDVICLVNVAPFSNERKGVRSFLNVAIEFHNRSIKDYCFINVGYDGNETALPPNFIGVPFVTDQIKLREYYSMADVLVCTSMLDGKPNTCIEALSCGTPLLCYDCSNMQDIAPSPLLTLSKASTDSLATCILNMGKKERIISEKCRMYAVENYDYKTIAMQLIEPALERLQLQL